MSLKTVTSLIPFNKESFYNGSGELNMYNYT